MNRRQRTELLIDYGKDDCVKYAQMIVDNHDIETVVEPQLGLLMIQQRETAQNTLFYAGEVLVTECKVRHGQHMGLGLVKGDQAEMAHALAVIDLAFVATWSETQDILTWLDQLVEVKRQTLDTQTRRYQQSRVDFSTMQQ